MILIGDSIIETLKAHTFSIGTVTVHESYSGSVAYPMLVLDELPGNDGVYIDGQPCIVRNILTLESYAKGKITMSKKSEAIQLLIEADKILNETFGLTMTGQIQAAPYSDPTVFRAVANYFAYIDTRTNTICRSIKK